MGGWKSAFCVDVASGRIWSHRAWRAGLGLVGFDCWAGEGRWCESGFFEWEGGLLALFGNARLRGWSEEMRLGEGAEVARWVGWSCGEVMVIEAPFSRTGSILTDCERNARKIRIIRKGKQEKSQEEIFEFWFSSLVELKARRMGAAALARAIWP